MMRKGFTKFFSNFFGKVKNRQFKELTTDKEEIRLCKKFLENIIKLQLSYFEYPLELITIIPSKDENYLEIGIQERFYQHLNVIKYYLEDEVKIPEKELRVTVVELYGDVVEPDYVLYCPIDQIVCSELFKDFLESGIISLPSRTLSS